MNLKELMVDTKKAWVSYGGLSGFEVEVVNIGREKLAKLRKDCVTTRFVRGSGTVDELDEQKFVRKFTDEAIKNWKGLKLEYVESLMLVDISSENPEAELPYSQDNAELLVKNSSDFDNWVNEVVFDLENFRSKRD